MFPGHCIMAQRPPPHAGVCTKKRKDSLSQVLRWTAEDQVAGFGLGGAAVAFNDTILISRYLSKVFRTTRYGHRIINSVVCV